MAICNFLPSKRNLERTASDLKRSSGRIPFDQANLTRRQYGVGLGLGIGRLTDVSQDRNPGGYRVVERGARYAERS